MVESDFEPISILNKSMLFPLYSAVALNVTHVPTPSIHNKESHKTQGRLFGWEPCWQVLENGWSD